MSSGAPYGRVWRSLWSDPWFRGLPEAARLVYLYLLTGPHSHMSGIMQLSPAIIADDLSLDATDVRTSLTGPLAAHVEYDDHTRELFVPDAGRVQVGETLKRSDNLQTHIERHLAGIHSERLKARFIEVYGGPWNLTPVGATQGGVEAPSKPSQASHSPIQPNPGPAQPTREAETAAGLSTGERQRRFSGSGEFSPDDIARAARDISKPGRTEYHVALMERDPELIEVAVGLRWLCDTGAEFDRGERFFALDTLLDKQPELRVRSLDAYRRKLDAEIPRTGRLEAV